MLVKPELVKGKIEQYAGNLVPQLTAENLGSFENLIKKCRIVESRRSATFYQLANFHYVVVVEFFGRNVCQAARSLLLSVVFSGSRVIGWKIRTQ